jgi:high-affinity K+ transport system ATPase subunit B
MEDISKLTKKELEELGREHGVELDRRKKKDDLIEELREVVGDIPVQEEAEVIAEQTPVDDNFYTDRREAIKVVRKSGGRVKAVEGGFKIIRRKRRR